MQIGITILISDKRDFKLKLLGRCKEGHFILIKVIANQKDITFNHANYG